MRATALCALSGVLAAQTGPSLDLPAVIPVHTAPDDSAGGAYGLWAAGRGYGAITVFADITRAWDAQDGRLAGIGGPGKVVTAFVRGFPIGGTLPGSRQRVVLGESDH